MLGSSFLHSSMSNKLYYFQIGRKQSLYVQCLKRIIAFIVRSEVTGYVLVELLCQCVASSIAPRVACQ